MDNTASFKKKKKNHLGVARTLKKCTKVFFICSDGQSVTGCLNEEISNNKNNITLYMHRTLLHMYKLSLEIMYGCMGTPVHIYVLTSNIHLSIELNL